MTVSRWKVMAGVLGVSLGGLAAIAGQCPRPDNSKTQRSEDPPVAEAPKVPMVVPPGGSGATKPAAPAELPSLPALPGIPTAPAATIPALPTTPDAPALPAVPPPSTSGLAPALPMPSEPKPAVPVVPSIGSSASPVVPAGATTPAVPTAPAGGFPSSPPSVAPSAPPVGSPTPAATPIEFTKPATAPTPPATTTVPTAELETIRKQAADSPSRPTATAVPPGATPANTLPPAPMVSGPERGLDPLVTPPAPPATAPITTVAPPAVAATKFRIVLRVGEGEPAFEVRSGDDLVLKVACEKVDVKSPEKGQGHSAVVASGKVRFVGFGAEGTCDNLSFLAGTGEVSMTGNVKIQVKDKLGRVESELTTESIKYKIDASALPGTLKP